MICHLPAIVLEYEPNDASDCHWTARIATICDGVGPTPQEAVADVLDTFASVWAHYACVHDDSLAPDAIALKRQLLAIIDAEAAQ
jgi:hypothetical protein